MLIGFRGTARTRLRSYRISITWGLMATVQEQECRGLRPDQLFQGQRRQSVEIAGRARGEPDTAFREILLGCLAVSRDVDNVPVAAGHFARDFLRSCFGRGDRAVNDANSFAQQKNHQAFQIMQFLGNSIFMPAGPRRATADAPPSPTGRLAATERRAASLPLEGRIRTAPRAGGSRTIALSPIATPPAAHSSPRRAPHRKPPACFPDTGGNSESGYRWGLPGCRSTPAPPCTAAASCRRD